MHLHVCQAYYGKTQNSLLMLHVVKLQVGISTMRLPASSNFSCSLHSASIHTQVSTVKQMSFQQSGYGS